MGALPGRADPIDAPHSPNRHAGDPVLNRRETPLDPLAELMLFCAARADLVSRVIRPALEQGRTVICDRFTDSTIAFNA